MQTSHVLSEFSAENLLAVVEFSQFRTAASRATGHLSLSPDQVKVSSGSASDKLGKPALQAVNSGSAEEKSEGGIEMTALFW